MLEESVVIDRSPLDVWNHVADLRTTPQWRTTVTSVDPPEVMAAGAPFEATTQVLGRRWQWRLTLTEFDPPTSLTMAVSEGFTSLRTTYRVAPVDGGCRFTLAASSDADRLVERLVEPIAARVLRRHAIRHLAALKRTLEASACA